MPVVEGLDIEEHGAIMEKVYNKEISGTKKINETIRASMHSTHTTMQ